MPSDEPIDYVNTYLSIHRVVRIRMDDSVSPGDNIMLDRRPQLTLGSGLVISIQASGYHYCSPKDPYGPYVSVEVMIIHGKTPQSWLDQHGYEAEDSIYGWLPVDLLNQTIEDLGGIVGMEDKT